MIYWQAHQNNSLSVHKENRLYWQAMCFVYWHGTIFETYWQDRIHWQDCFEHPIVNLCQYMTKTEYTGQPCVFYTGTEQYLNHTGTETEYTRLPTVCWVPCAMIMHGGALRQARQYCIAQ